MAINFCPNRDQMAKEIEQCAAASKLEVLVSFCKCCVYQVFDTSTLVSECRMCGIQKGIRKIAQANTWTEAPDLEFLGVC